ncbi:MAG: hypothetical protein Q4D88_01995 [Anaerococcus sp.]|nr:hypothetical protein [Anaerococcus sp.]
MNKKGSITIYVLIILLFVSIIFTFLTDQVRNDRDLNKNLIDRKQVSYNSQSVINIFIKNRREDIVEYILKNDGKDQSDTDRFNQTYKGRSYRLYLKYYKSHPEIKEFDGTYMIVNDFAYLDTSRAMTRYFLKADINPILDTINPPAYKDKADLYDKITYAQDPLRYENLKIDESIKDSYEGLIIVNNDLILDKDFTVEGILIVKGRLISNGNLLKVKGQFIGNETDISTIEVHRDRALIRKYLVIDENICDYYIYSQYLDE